MRSRSSVYLVLSVLLAAALGLYLFYLPRLPDRLATHFGKDGRANGWMDRDTFRWFYWAMLLGVPLLFAGITFLIRILPSSLVNIPNREYWLAPERKGATLRRLEDRMIWLAAATLAFLLTLFHATFRANLGREAAPTLGKEFWFYFAGYMLFTLGWTVSLLFAFRKPKEGPPGSGGNDPLR